MPRRERDATVKNVLFVNYGDNWIRGQELCLINLVKNVDRARYNPIAICNASELEKQLTAAGVPTYLTDIPEISIDRRDSKLDLLAYSKALLAWRAVIKRHRIDLIYSNSGLPSQLAYPLAKWFSIPLVVHVHSPYRRRYAWMWFYKFADRVIFVSAATRKAVESEVRFGKPVSVVYNGVDTDRFKPPPARDASVRSALGVAEGDVVIGQVGSLIERKGVDLLLEAFATLSRSHANVKLVIVGDGPERDGLRALSRTLSIDGRVRFVGDVGDTERYYSQVLDINVLASRKEAFPLALLEGAASGLPNVGSRVGGVPELIQEGVDGFVFDREDVDELAARLARLVDDRDLRSSMGRAGREKVEARFTIEAYARNIEAELDSCLSS